MGGMGNGARMGSIASSVIEISTALGGAPASAAPVAGAATVVLVGGVACAGAAGGWAQAAKMHQARQRTSVLVARAAAGSEPPGQWVIRVEAIMRDREQTISSPAPRA